MFVSYVQMYKYQDILSIQVSQYISMVIIPKTESFTAIYHLHITGRLLVTRNEKN